MCKRNFRSSLAVAIPLAISLALGGCGGVPTNRSLESLHQPIVQRTNYALELTASPAGLPLTEQHRLAGWFEALNLRYGDRIAIDDPLANGPARTAVEGIAGRFGLLVGSDLPVTPGDVPAGNLRVIVTRSSAAVPGCPDWSAKSDTNLDNATPSNFGCAMNANLAAMAADPEHLLHGAGSAGQTTIMSSTKAIDSYREAPPSGQKGLKQESTQGGK